MQFTNILTLISLTAAFGASSPALAQGTRSDNVVLEMNSAFQKGNSNRLTELLPYTRGHALEPWAAYWELRARLDFATPDEMEAFFSKYQGSYQEDRLRNDWLLLLGQRRDWSRFAVVAQNFRMNDDREVRCYTLAMEQILIGVDLAEEVKTQWYRQKDGGAGCALAAERHFAANKLSETDIWRKARLALEARQLKSARLAVEIVAREAGAALTSLANNPGLFLARLPASSQPLTQELAVLALIRWADSDPDAAAQALSGQWSRYLSAGQRGWAWGAIGKQAAQKLSDNAVGYFGKASPAGMSDEHLAWRVRAALRQNQWRDVQSAMPPGSIGVRGP